MLPYIAVVLGYGLLFFAHRADWGTLAGNLLLGAVGLTGLVIVRQVNASRDERRAHAAVQAIRADLERTNAALDQRVQERTATLEAALAAQSAQAAALQTALAIQEAQAQELQASLDIQQQLNETIAALSVPVIPVRDDVLIVPLIGAIDSHRANLLLETVLQRVQATHAQQVFMDVTGVAVIDTQVAQVLLRTAAALRLLGAEAVLVGIRPDVAHTLVQLGADFSMFRTAASLQAGLERANGGRGQRIRLPG